MFESYLILRQKVIHAKTTPKDFKFNHNLKNMTVNAAAQFLSTVLYGNRFFPKYTHCILAGLDRDGTCPNPVFFSMNFSLTNGGRQGPPLLL